MKKSLRRRRGNKCFAVSAAVLVLTLAALCFRTDDEETVTAQATEYVSVEIPTEYGQKGSSTNPFVLLEIVPYIGDAQMGYLVPGEEPMDFDTMVEAYKLGYRTPLGSVASLGFADVYFQYYPYIDVVYENKDIFRREVLGLTEEEIAAGYAVKVISVTPDMLVGDNLKLIERADMITLNSTPDWNSTRTWWDDYWYLRRDIPYTYGWSEHTEFGDNDLSWEATMAVLEKVVGVNGDAAPIIMNTSIIKKNSPKKNIETIRVFGNGSVLRVNSEGSINNVYKLYLMLQQMDPAVFYEKFVETGLITEMTVGGRTTGAYGKLTGDEAAYWNWYTFLPYEVFYSWGELESYRSSAYGYTPFSVANLDGKKEKISDTNSPILLQPVYEPWITEYSYVYNSDQSTLVNILRNMVRYNRYTEKAFSYIYPDLQEDSGISNMTITPAQIMQYLLNISAERGDAGEKDENAAIRILDIEPSGAFRKTAKDFAKMLKGMYTGTEKNISVTYITSSEFIGKQINLFETFDLIYIGTDTSAFAADCLQQNGMYAYMAQGEKVNVTSDLYYKVNGEIYNFWGVQYGPVNVKSEYPSGNDFTWLKLNEMKQFAENGKVILLDTGFFNCNSVMSAEKGMISLGESDINGNIIDRNSNIYAFVSMVLEKDTKGVYCNACISGDEKKEIKERLNKESLKVTIEKWPNLYAEKAEEDASRYLEDNILSLEFNVAGEASKYRVKLYIDVNSDGVFADGEELEEFSIARTTASEGVYQEITDFRENGISNGTYILEYDLEGYVGPIPWKFTVSDFNNPVIAVETSAISAVRRKNTKKAELDILQIMPDDEAARTILLPDSEDVAKFEEALALDLHLPYNATDAEIIDSVARYLGVSDSDDRTRSTIGLWYYLRILDEYDVVIERMTVKEFTKKLENTEAGFNLNDYDMLIFGFADMYQDLKSEVVHNKVNEYISNGKSVMFSHDTTSTYMTPDKANLDWGYYFTRAFRNILGMDRFDIMNHEDTTEDVYGIEGRMAYTNATLQRYKLNSGATTSIETCRAKQLNSGIVTSYPYLIDEEIPIAATHAQYFQLDMEDENIVVWYCLDEDSKTDAYSSIYANPEKDGRNNYYQYSKNNITYTGMGHSSALTEMEMKLFVNTIVASYRTTKAKIEIEITNSDTKLDSGVDYIYVNYDVNDRNIVGSATGADIVEYNGEKHQSVSYVTDEGVLINEKSLSVIYFKTEKTVENITDIGDYITALVVKKKQEAEEGAYFPEGIVGAAVKEAVAGFIPVSEGEYTVIIPDSEGTTYNITITDQYIYGESSGFTTLYNDSQITSEQYNTLNADEREKVSFLLPLDMLQSNKNVNVVILAATTTKSGSVSKYAVKNLSIRARALFGLN